jgi:hypothetical protein
VRAPPGPPYVAIWMMMRDRSCARRCGSAAHDLNRAQQVGTDLVGEFLDRTEQAVACVVDHDVNRAERLVMP